MTNLPQALEALRCFGWGKGHLKNPEDGTLCAMGALNMAEFLNAESHLLIQEPATVPDAVADMNALAKVVDEQYPDRVVDYGSRALCVAWTKIAGFNNHEYTTFADVEKVFEKAIAARHEEVD
jgi:hypothetical protein